MAYSVDLRERAIALAKEVGKGEAARLLKVDRGCIREWMKRAEAGKLKHDTSPGRPRLIEGEAAKLLEEQVEAHNDATLEEHCQTWAATGRGNVSITTMHRTLERLEVTRKKRPSRPPSATKRSGNSGGKKSSR